MKLAADRQLYTLLLGVSSFIEIIIIISFRLPCEKIKTKYLQVYN